MKEILSSLNKTIFVGFLLSVLFLLIALSTLSFGIFTLLALVIAKRSRGLDSGSVPAIFTAI